MVNAMDLNVGRIVDAMKGAGLWDNTLLIFSTDNGGWPDQGGNNDPYKGGKFTLWEGGTKGVAFVHGNMLVETGYTNNEMIHAVDWFPTIVAAAGGNTDDIEDMDGINQLDTILKGVETKRTEFVYNIDETVDPDGDTAPQGAIRVGNWKLIEGYVGDDEDGNPNIGEWLFDLEADPYEDNNLATTQPDKLEEMKEKLRQYKNDGKMVHAIFPDIDPNSLPILDENDGAWSPGWCTAIVNGDKKPSARLAHERVLDSLELHASAKAAHERVLDSLELQAFSKAGSLTSHQ
uniref:Sulfatase N-terminal domain-containing protein n=1 Tax=Branchiostoma floridae TaxID=7739 RepID=C3YF69_BRAFL|eukprot:XP_002605061.1 hypothetical protein BRAFLDRAFT_85207 [Branchiostoma floridae]